MPAPAIPTMPIVLIPEDEDAGAEVVAAEADAEETWLELTVWVTTVGPAELVVSKELED
jgi:hypothetical protein